MKRIGMLAVLGCMLSMAGPSATAQDETLIQSARECFNEVFKRSRFDSTYYRHNVAKGEPCFFLVENETTDTLKKFFPKNQDYLHLENGNLISIASQGIFFVTGVRHYLKLISFDISPTHCSLVLEEIAYNGVREFKMRERNVTLTRRNTWEITSEN